MERYYIKNSQFKLEALKAKNEKAESNRRVIGEGVVPRDRMMYKICVGPNHPPGGWFECLPPFILPTLGSITIYLDPGPSPFRHPEKAVKFVKVNYKLPNRNTRVNISKLANKAFPSC